MFPDDIIKIVKKYNDNPERIRSINTSIKNITGRLKGINRIISNKVSELILDENTENNIEELVQESIILRNYINTLTTIEGIENVPNVYVYLINETTCPFCNIKLQSKPIPFKRTIGENRTEEIVRWHWCQKCQRYYVLDSEAKKFNFENSNIKLNHSKYTEIEEVETENIENINIHSLIVLKNTLKCSQNHNVIDILAKIPVLDENGALSYAKVNASFCQVCNRYTVLKNDFEKLDGIPMCKVMDDTQEVKNQETDMPFEFLQNKSLLTLYGYNVQTQANISKIQRQCILSVLLKAQIMSKREIIDHISTCIERGEKIPSWKIATEKWKEDRDFVANFSIGDLPEKSFDNIVLKYVK